MERTLKGRKGIDWYLEVPNQGKWGEGRKGGRENKIWNKLKFVEHYL